MSLSTVTEISELMQAYFDGLYAADSAQLRQVFHPRLAYVCATEGDELCLDLDTYMARVDTRQPPAARAEIRQDEVKGISLVGERLAHVQARMTMMGRTYHDELTLIRHDERWQIVTKVFSYIPDEV